ncbi:hypothetical protein OTU49_005526 [Cherax quadricarinatus]|uniref:Uncharacterized protein n=1 Tax=Cherax quadricarinatus TaxID=27406 RepID=A0AAW0WW36_CHEQU
MYTTLTREPRTQTRAVEATTTMTTTVQMVPLVGPAYLRRGAQVCGRKVGRTCIFLLASFGVACSMIGVVLFTSDLQMLTGFWIAGTLMMVLGVVLMLMFFTLCCIAWHAFQALPSGHPDRVKLYRPVPVPSRTSSTYQLLPLRQAPSYAPVPAGQQPGACSSSPRAQPGSYCKSPGGMISGYPSSPGDLTNEYSTLPGRLTPGYPPSPGGLSAGYPTIHGRRVVGYPSSPTRNSIGYSTLPGGRAVGYPMGQSLGTPTSPRGQHAGYLTPHGSQTADYSTLPGGRAAGYHTPLLMQPFSYLESPRGSIGGYSTLPVQHLTPGYRSPVGERSPGYLTPTVGQTMYKDEVKTRLFAPEASATSTPQGTYKRREERPQYSNGLPES